MPSQADGTNGAGRGASLLPEHYTDDAAEAASAPTSESAPVEAIVVAEPVVEPPAPPRPGISESRARSLANLRPPYRKGESGNRNGRPKGIVSKALTKALKKRMADSDERVVEALCRKYTEKALEELDPARFNSIRDTVDGRPASQDDGAGAAVGIIVQLEIVGK